MPKGVSLSHDLNYVANRESKTRGISLDGNKNACFQPDHPIHPRSQFQIVGGN